MQSFAGLFKVRLAGTGFAKKTTYRAPEQDKDHTLSATILPDVMLWPPPDKLDT